MQAQRLANGRVEVGLVLAAALERVRSAEELVEGPRERGGRRLVAGEQQRDELVAQLAVGHRLAVLVTGLQQQREDVVTLGERGVVAPARDLLEQHRVHGGDLALERRAEVERADPPRHVHEQLGERSGDVGERGLDRRADPRAPPRVIEPEDRLQDHLERDRLEARLQREGLARGPAVDLALGGLRDELAVGGHALAVERRQEQLALAHVRGAVEQQDRRRAEHRRHRLAQLADRELVGAGGEHDLDRGRVGEEDDVAEAALAEACQAQREGVAVAAVAGLEERGGARAPRENLQRRGHARAGRKFVPRHSPRG